MSEQRPLSQPLQTTQVWFLIGTATLGLLPFLQSLPLALKFLIPLLLIWRVWLNLRARPLPPRLVMVLIAAAGVVLVAATYHTLVGRVAGLALLTWLLPLKLMEMRTRRDARVAIMLCCFMLTGQFLNQQSALVAVFVLVCATAIIMTSAKLQQPGLDLRATGGLAGRLILAAIPLMAMLFVLFPRIDTPLWGMPMDTPTSTTGLSDNMEPGSIAQLILNGEIAFRVEFQGPLPPPRERYWRGPVLTDFDGQTWHQRKSGILMKPAYRVSGPAYSYWMTLEPHDQGWLLAMDFPDHQTENAVFSDDLSLISRRPVSRRQRYHVNSFPQSQVGLDERKYVLDTALRLPSGFNPRTVALGRKIAQDNPDPAQRVLEAQRFLREDRLTYTLVPPEMGRDTADEFLFNSKQGFCEHFSSSFAVLMRAAGVPTRVVTGYQGGEFNPMDGTFVIRQSDAHAWDEVWLSGRGWVRVDPTAIAMPNRIDNGLAQAVGDAGLPMLLRQDNAFVRNLRYRLEALSNAWNQWVLGYNARRQLELLQDLGMPDADWRTLAQLLGGGAALWLLWLTWHLWPRLPHADALDRCWYRFCARLARRGVHRFDWEGPDDFAQRAARVLPASAGAILDIAQRYAQMRYGPPGSFTQTRVAALRRAVQQFRP